ncbi:MAG: NADH-quinone oxidoreductase subunit J [Chloroflexi bacterium]|nr:NADH-quinone oxidoreductase subunit J [Chloroflexota bacterium]
MALPPTVPYFDIAWDDLLFLTFGGLMLAAALGVVLGRNIIRSGLAMILSFAALAGIYALLGAPLVAAAQVLIYIGAISVLVLFAIMLTQSKSGPASLVFHHQAWAAALAAIVLALLLVSMVAGAEWPRAVAERVHTATGDVARLLFDEFVLPFEVVSVLLLAAVIGGVFLAKREDTDVPETEAGARQVTLGSEPGGASGRAASGIASATIVAAEDLGRRP